MGVYIIFPLLILIVLATMRFFALSKIAGGLMIPYILWVSFAAWLNVTIMRLN
jgi:tryptophan-rich sensory protein